MRSDLFETGMQTFNDIYCKEQKVLRTQKENNKIGYSSTYDNKTKETKKNLRVLDNIGIIIAWRKIKIEFADEK